jgi:hypothetical protein
MPSRKTLVAVAQFVLVATACAAAASLWAQVRPETGLLPSMQAQDA